MKHENELFPVQAAELSDAVYMRRNGPCKRCGGLINRKEKAGHGRGNRGCHSCRNYDTHLHDRYLKKAFIWHRSGRRIPSRVQAMIMPDGKGFAVKLAAELSALDVTEEDYDAKGPQGWVFSYAKPLRDLPFQASDEVIRLFLQSWFVRLKSDSGRRADGR